MTDYRNYSNVLSVSYGDMYGRFLQLDCGHEVYRYGKVAPKKVKCERCFLTPRAANGATCACHQFTPSQYNRGKCGVCGKPRRR